MRKIPSIFLRDWEGNRNLVTREPNPECQWVFDGFGIATKKYDGTCCMVKEGKLYRRYEVKKGNKPPEDFIPVETDEKTNNQVGWIPVTEKPDDKWHRIALQNHEDNFPSPVNLDKLTIKDGTYELCGPKINSNPENLDSHLLIPHGHNQFPLAPRDYDGLKEFLSNPNSYPIEGLVWHHPDGRMAKIKARDLGIPWPRGKDK